MSAIAWPDLLRLALRLGVQPADFWRLSLVEWRALTTATTHAPSRANLNAMLAAFPDETTR